ncbi:hypothetical protein [Thermocoleostomius sinensis]|uniref:Iron-containing redox enzyme family protein n=1 Tax=Thermocoleostomius sinensis A174 TaxID=2016057 RepID=A0A9E8ZMZ9_9CYAN|nr:hypothetical protein [Thermocoleostomius sinensis]WAL61496.1 hypothetical protein OXH18_05770 [Thermocoleostomius sinensis A174]
MQEILQVIQKAKTIFRLKLEQVEQSGGLTLEQYVRYLSMQYHLTRNVQRHFFTIAGHPLLAHKGKLREFLVAFGLEEEMHYKIACKDLENLGYDVLPVPLDVKLWWTYFDSVIHSRPLVRLGATCILENLGAGGGDVVKRLMSNAPFINERTSRFVQIHLHEELPHGDWIVQTLKDVPLDVANIRDLREGAETGAILYLRMVNWALGTDYLTNCILEEPTNALPSQVA